MTVLLEYFLLVTSNKTTVIVTVLVALVSYATIILPAFTKLQSFEPHR